MNQVHRRTRLYGRRVELKLSMHQVAKLSGVQAGRLSEYERALSEPRVTAAMRLARALGTTVEELFK